MLIKPASSLCNLRCRYCFYADESGSRSVESYGIMTEQTARSVIEKAFRQAMGRGNFPGGGNVHFAFQGGEPTMAGLPFYEMFTQTAAKLKPDGVRVSYSIQTNGIVLDRAWCELFRENGFLVGLSFDGYPQVHDYLRVGADGDGTSRKVLAAAALLRQSRVDFNILTVVTKQLAKHPTQVFEFYKKNDFGFVQLIPCLSPLDAPDAREPYTLPPRLYAAFLTALFRLWRDGLQNGRYISIRLFDNIVQMLRGESAEQCGLQGSCNLQFVIEADGGVYPCDFYALDEYRAGSINDSDFSQLAQTDVMRDFLRERPAGSPLCAECAVFSLCRGGCRRYRSFQFSEDGYCPVQDFLHQTVGDFRRIAAIR